MKTDNDSSVRIDKKARTFLLFATSVFWMISNASGEVPPQWQFVVDHAPLVWLAKGETYFPSAVEYVMAHTRIDGDWGAVTKERLSGPSVVLPYFHGVDPSKDPSHVPIYAFVFPEKGQPAIEAISHPETSRIRVIYYTFYPYNLGKEVKIKLAGVKLTDSVWGNHVTDIEKCYVTFEKKVPVSMYCAAHSNQEQTLEWRNVPKEATHPVVYSALGSHGLYFGPGRRVYYEKKLDLKITDLPLFSLADEMSAGTRWETWKNVDLILPQDWTRVPSPAPAGWENVPYIISVNRWGNRADGCRLQSLGISECPLNPGPTGFLGKGEVAALLEDMDWARPDGHLSICKATKPSNRCPWPAGIWSIRDDPNCLPGYLYSKNRDACYLKPYKYSEAPFTSPSGYRCSPFVSCGYGWDSQIEPEHGCPDVCCCYCCIKGGMTIPSEIRHYICGRDGKWYDYSELASNDNFTFNPHHGFELVYACLREKDYYTCAVP